MKLLATLAFCLCYNVLLVRGDVFTECNGIDGKKFIASKQSCAHYIFCDGDESYDGDCVDGQYFSEEFQMCDDKESVSCRDGDVDANETSSTESGGWASDLDTTSTTASANSTLVVVSTAPENSTVSSLTAVESQNTTTLAASESVMSTTAASSSTAVMLNATQSPPISTTVATNCPVVDDPKRLVFVSSEKSCSSYFVCLSGERLAMQCASKLHFNPQTGKCDYPENVKCLHGFSNAREQCQSDVVDVFPHPQKCNYYYVCQNGYLLLNQCPFFYGWDYERRSCVEIGRASCYDNAKRF